MSDALFNQLQAGEITRVEYDERFHASLQDGVEQAKAGKGTVVVDVDAFIASL